MSDDSPSHTPDEPQEQASPPLHEATAPEPQADPQGHHTTRSVPTPLPHEARVEVMLIFGLFVTLRLMTAWWFRPLYSEAGSFFYPFLYLMRGGYYPFFDYWLEYPPVLTYALVGIHWVSVQVCGAGSVAWERACFVRTVQVASILLETGSLGIVYALARRLRGARAAAKACWVYLALFSTAFVALSYVDALPVFLMLIAVVLTYRGRAVWSAAAVAAGFMAKVLPIVLLPTVLKADRRWRWRLAAIGVFIMFSGYFAAPFLVTGRHWLWHSLESSLRRPPWETVWALLDDRYEFGYVGPMPADQNGRFFADYRVEPGTRGLLAAMPREVLGGGPARRILHYRVASRFARDLSFIDSAPRTQWFWWVYGGVGLVLGAFYLITFASVPQELLPRRRVAFATFSLFVFFFFSKGWSPQFVLYLIPLLLITFPVGEAALWCLLLTVTAFLETPLWTHYVHPLKLMNSASPLAAFDHLLLQVAVLGRSALLLIVGVRVFPRLFRD